MTARPLRHKGQKGDRSYFWDVVSFRDNACSSSTMTAVIPPTRGNFARCVDNISSERNQEHGYMEINKEFISNSMDKSDKSLVCLHEAIIKGCHSQTFQGFTAVLFLDDSRGCDTAPLTHLNTDGPQSTLHSMFCYGQSSNQRSDGNQGRFCAGFTLIKHAADSGMCICTKTERSQDYFIYDSDAPIQDVINSERECQGIANLSTLPKTASKPLECFQTRLQKMLGGQLPAAWLKILDTFTTLTQKNKSGTCVMVISTGVLHSMNRFSLEVGWRKPGGKTCKANTLVKCDSERNCLVTYMRTKTRLGSTLNASYSEKHLNNLLLLAQNKGDLGLQRALRKCSMTLYDTEWCPEGFEVPYGMPFIARKDCLQANQANPLTNLTCDNLKNSGVFIRSAVQHFRACGDKNFYISVFFDSKKRQNEGYEYLDRLGNNGSRGGIYVWDQFGGVHLTALGVHVQKLGKRLEEDLLSKLPVDKSNCLTQQELNMWKCALKACESQLTILVDSDWAMCQDRLRVGSHDLTTIAHPDWKAGLSKALKTIMMENGREGLQLQYLLKWSEGQTRKKNENDARAFRNARQDEFFSQTRIKFVPKLGITVPDPLKSLSNHVIAIGVCESALVNMYHEFTSMFGNASDESFLARYEIPRIISDRQTRNNGVDTLVRCGNAVIKELGREDFYRSVEHCEFKLSLNDGNLNHNLQCIDYIVVPNLEDLPSSVTDCLEQTGDITEYFYNSGKSCPFMRTISSITKDGNIVLKADSCDVHSVVVLGFKQMVLTCTAPWFDVKHIMPLSGKRNADASGKAKGVKRPRPLW